VTTAAAGVITSTTTFHISAPGGGDCAAIGVWDTNKNRCTLNSDVTVSGADGIRIESSGVTLDGKDLVDGTIHTLKGSLTSGTNGVYLSGITGATIQNLKVEQFGFGFRLYSSSGNRLSGNTAYSNALTGIYLDSSYNNTICRNNFIDNANWLQAYDYLGSGNVFSLAAPIGGNYWSNFHTPLQGCSDNDNDGFCDAPYFFTGGQDDLPLTQPAVCDKPALSISYSAYWPSYAEYVIGNLTVLYVIHNSPGNDAFNVQILDAPASTPGVTLTTTVPVSVGDINTGSSSGPAEFIYYDPDHIPFTTQPTASAQDTCGNIYTYPP